MKIDYHHLLNFIKSNPSMMDISSKLFQLGHEHEIEDSIFNMEFTPNRGDCLSLIGLARDLSVFYDTDLSLDLFKDEIPALNIDFINETPDKCPRISFLNIEIEDHVSEYKDYLENYFVDLKINKNNFFTDISNYIAYEMGQPTHSYHFSSINGAITLKNNTNEVDFKTLLNNTIKLKDSDLVFTNQDVVINLAGIIGSAKTACKENTKNALIECAYFLPESIIGKAIKYDLHSDASHKFERGVDPLCHEKVLRRFIQIVQDHSEIKTLGIYSESTNNFNELELDIDLNIINSILGININTDDYLCSLKKLGFGVDNSIKVPSYRSDITQQNDLAEEVARVIGYDNIAVQPFTLPKLEEIEDLNSQEMKIKTLLVDHGFCEVINSPFCSINSSNAIKVDNPLDSNRQFLRKNLTNSLLENLVYNEKRQKDSIKLFEIADTYTILDGQTEKTRKISLIASGRVGKNYRDFSKIINKKYINEIFSCLSDIPLKFLDVDRSKLDSKSKTPVVLFEANLEDFDRNNVNYAPLFQRNKTISQYTPISDFPSTNRDISFALKDPLKVKELEDAINSLDNNLLKEVFMFDYFNNTKNNQIKLGYRFIFQSTSKTLTDEEVDDVMSYIMESTLQLAGIEIPGYSSS